MKRKTLATSLAVMATLVLLLGTMNAHAKTPDSFNCLSGCSSWTYWNGTVYGGAVTFTVSDPGFFTSPASWDRYMRLGSGNPKIIVGIFKSTGGGYGTYCSGAGNNQLHYGVYGYDSTGFNDYNLCLNVPSSDVNKPVTIYVHTDDADCGEHDGTNDEVQVQWSFADFSNFTCVDNEATTYNRIQLQEDVVDSVSGHQVWGSQWTNSSWANSAGAFVYQGRSVDFLSARNPPQMLWHTNPAPGNNGGNLYTCVYDTGTTCTPGS